MSLSVHMVQISTAGFRANFLGRGSLIRRLVLPLTLTERRILLQIGQRALQCHSHNPSLFFICSDLHFRLDCHRDRVRAMTHEAQVVSTRRDRSPHQSLFECYWRRSSHSDSKIQVLGLEDVAFSDIEVGARLYSDATIQKRAEFQGGSSRNERVQFVLCG